MPRKLEPFWRDSGLINGVNFATDFVVHVFALPRQLTARQIDKVIRRIETRQFAAAEQQRAAEFIDRQSVPELAAKDRGISENVFDAGRPPRSWEDLADALNPSVLPAEFKCFLRDEIAKELQRGWRGGHIGGDVVLRKTLRLLFSQVVRRGKWLANELCERGSFHDWLQQQSLLNIKRSAHPSRVWEDYELLRRVGEAWDGSETQVGMRQTLGLPDDPAHCPRELIDARREKLARARLKRDRAVPITSQEIYAAVPWPAAIREITSILMDREQAPDLHAVGNYYAEVALTKRRNHCPRLALPEVDDVVLEFLERMVWRVIKGAQAQVQKRTSEEFSWGGLVFGEYLLNDAYKSINKIMGLPDNPGTPATREDDPDRPTPADPSETTSPAKGRPRTSSQDNLKEIKDPNAKRPDEILEAERRPELPKDGKKLLRKQIALMPQELREVMELYSRGAKVLAIAQKLGLIAEEVRRRIRDGMVSLCEAFGVVGDQ